MNVTECDLRRNYESQPTEHLLELRAKGTLTDLAQGLLEQVLNDREMSVDDRERATAEIKARLEKEEQVIRSLASLEARLGAQIIDTVIAFAILLGGVAISQPGFNAPTTYGTLLFLAYLLLADGLPGGRSLGKRIAGIAVIGERTKKPCTLLQSFVRNLLLMLLGIIDWLFILGERRKRLGDMAASTIVIKV